MILSFSGLCLENLPAGALRRITIDADRACDLVRAAAEADRLVGIFEFDPVPTRGRRSISTSSSPPWRTSMASSSTGGSSSRRMSRTPRTRMAGRPELPLNFDPVAAGVRFYRSASSRWNRRAGSTSSA